MFIWRSSASGVSDILVIKIIFVLTGVRRWAALRSNVPLPYSCTPYPIYDPVITVDPSNVTVGSEVVPTYPSYSPYSPSLMSEPQYLFSMLPSALQQLKRQYFKPTETAIKGALKSLQRNRLHKITITPPMWEEVVTLAQEDNYVISGVVPKRVLYLPSDCFEGADPDHPETEFPQEIWDALSVFLTEHSPGKKNGRFGFAECLSCKGPMVIRNVSNTLLQYSMLL